MVEAERNPKMAKLGVYKATSHHLATMAPMSICMLLYATLCCGLFLGLTDIDRKAP
jgi:hypothetical protein